MPSDPAKTKVRAIVGGTVIDPANNISKKLNVFIHDGAILELSDRKPDGGEGIIDATGMVVTPGFIDMHVHLREPGFEYKEDIESGCKAAEAGGFTTICCMPNTNPVNDSLETTRYIIDRAHEVAAINVLPVAALTKGSKGNELIDFDRLRKEGACAFSDDGMCIQDVELMKNALTQADAVGSIVIDHAEDFAITGNGVINEGEVAKKLGMPGIPREAENKIIQRDIELARDTGTHVHIAHLSTKESVKMIRDGKAKGIHITCEVTPHHLMLNESAVEQLGAHAVGKPPLRTEQDRQALVAGLADGTIDVIATDHAPHVNDEKSNVKTSAFGLIGMETMLPVCLKLVHEGLVSMNRFVDSITNAPAKILKLKGKGTLEKGADADITIFAPNEEITIDSSKFLSKARNTPFDGWTCKGRVIATIVSGNLVYET